jgi:hypothetical protein
MQPLRLDQVEDFLINCRQLFPEHFTISRSAYAKACKDYLADALKGEQPQKVLDLAQRILSNPMNLTMVALLGAYGKDPDLLHLREQQYQMMAEEYERLHQGQSFPLIQFSEQMYQMRLNDAMMLPWNRFPDEMTCMEYYKMVARRQSFDIYGNPTTEWHFRHDKIMEFFIAQAFVGNGNHRFNRHFEDLRFRGVYALLETLLSSDEMSRTPQTHNHNNKEEEVVIKKITQ